MKRLALMLALLTLAGCKRAMSNLEKDTQLGKDEKVKIIDRKGDQTGGAGGIMAVRKPAGRLVNDNDLKQLHLFITTAIDESGGNSMIDANQIMQVVRQDGSLVKAIEDKIIILTNTRDINGIWAYSQSPQRAGEHYVIRRGGREQMSPAALTAALQAQGSPVNIAP